MKSPSPARFGLPAFGSVLASAVGLALLLAACSSGDELGRRVFCPDAVRVQDAASLVRFSGSGRDLTDVLFEARLQEVALACTYDADENTIDGALRVAFFAARGPADTERRANFRYFVAIATEARQVIAREEFEVTIPFEGNRTQLGAVEELAPSIPLQPGESGSEYILFVGLVLSRDELEYNRVNR
ncbi:MAG: hypothetical protein ACFCUQ_15505 [Kiloniellales bacterium]